MAKEGSTVFERQKMGSTEELGITKDRGGLEENSHCGGLDQNLGSLKFSLQEFHIGKPVKRLRKTDVVLWSKTD